MTEVLGVVVVAASTLAAWWVWLGWDTRYEFDPATQTYRGPYEVWQVAGCVLTLIVIAAIAGWLVRPLAVTLAMTAVFTAAWTWRAASTDDSGLWAVGAVLVFAGMALGSAAVSFGARRFVNAVRRRVRPSS